MNHYISPVFLFRERPGVDEKSIRRINDRVLRNIA